MSQRTIVYLRPLVTMRDGLNFGLGFFIAVATGVVLSALATVAVGILAGTLALFLIDVNLH